MSQQLQDGGSLFSDLGDSDDDAEFVDLCDTTPPNLGGPSGPSLRAASRSPEPLLDLYILPEAEGGAQSSASTTSAASSTTPASTTASAGGIAVPQLRPAVYPLPELHILPSSPTTPTPRASLATAMPMTVEETPRLTAGFALPPSASSLGSCFIRRKFVRKFSGLTSVGTASPATAEDVVSPAVDAAGQLVPPSPGGREAKKSGE